jgi:large subunit ribosomal protein L10
MPTDKAVAEVEELKAVLSEAKLIISTDYRGLNVTELSALRRAIRDSGGTYRVAKNTLVKIASEEIGRPEISEIIVGPTGFVLSTDDPVGPARALMTHIQENRLDVVVNGAYLEGILVDAERVKYLSNLPSREVLIGKVLGQMNAPIANLVGVLSGTLRGLMTVLQAHIDQGGNALATESAEAEATEAVPEAAAEEAEAPAAEVEAETTEEESADESEAAAEEPVAEAEAEEATEEESADKPEAAAEEPVAEAEAEEATEEESADEPEAEAEEPVTETEAETTEEESADEPEAESEEPVAETEAEATEEESAEEPEADAEEPVAETDSEAPEDAEETGEADEDKPAE